MMYFLAEDGYGDMTLWRANSENDQRPDAVAVKDECSVVMWDLLLSGAGLTERSGPVPTKIWEATAKVATLERVVQVERSNDVGWEICELINDVVRRIYPAIKDGE